MKHSMMIKELMDWLDKENKKIVDANHKDCIHCIDFIGVLKDVKSKIKELAKKDLETLRVVKDKGIDEDAHKRLFKKLVEDLEEVVRS